MCLAKTKEIVSSIRCAEPENEANSSWLQVAVQNTPGPILFAGSVRLKMLLVLEHTVKG